MYPGFQLCADYRLYFDYDTILTIFSLLTTESTLTIEFTPVMESTQTIDFTFAIESVLTIESLPSIDSIMVVDMPRLSALPEIWRIFFDYEVSTLSLNKPPGGEGRELWSRGLHHGDLMMNGHKSSVTMVSSVTFTVEVTTRARRGEQTEDLCLAGRKQLF
ncbi:hypothetical protein RRG08_065639 [Elysia crispata]|uniref:Uncharacterized protein n=1 Tax=Elysia crispata TaxID=231223 RepID=A0AAE1D1G4_9GAST|nr:hypothetical protein RRG08_065639 [Elysia crispata]